jgi:hypothetical protein
MEDEAEEVQHILDDLRVRYDFALVIEHHAPKGNHDNRDLVPFGSQRWMAWPELGITLRKMDDSTADMPATDRWLEVGRYREDRYACPWPTQLRRTNGDWPWIGTWEPGEDPDRIADDYGLAF